jgi:hypothetical protein
MQFLDSITGSSEDAVDALGDAFGFNGSWDNGVGQIGTYFWTKDFKQFLYSYSDVMGSKGNWNLDPGYSFKVVASDSTAPFAAFGEFKLPLNPSNFQQNEEMAISFKPTQNGMVIEHSGIIFREIVLSGTTGQAPSGGFAKSDDFIASQGSLSSTLGKIPTSVEGLWGTLSGAVSGFNTSNTGYTWCHLLRNYFRSYAQTKCLPQGRNLSLVFVNRKDNEEWCAEPTSFDITRSAGKAFLYDYRITLRAYKRNVPSGSAVGWWQDIIDGIENVENIVNNAVALVGGAYNILVGAVTELKQIESAVVSTIMTPTANLLETLNGVKDAAAQFPATQRKVWSEYKDEVQRVKNSWEDLTGQGSSGYNTVYARTPAATPATGRTPSAREVEITSALNDLILGTNRILSTNAIYVSDAINPNVTSVSQSSETTNTTLNSPSNLARRASSKSQIEAAFNNTVRLNSPQSVRQIIINRDDTLEDIALRTTGNVANWVEISIINDLVYPYIDETIALTNNRVKKRGDTLLVPSSASQSTLLFTARETSLTSALTPQEKFLGVDLRVDKDFDLILSNNQDFLLAYGTYNALQAINTRLALERGSLKYHPTVGMSLDAGSRSPMMAQNFAISIKDNLLVDDRFEDVSKISVVKVGATYTININVKIANYNEPIPLTIRL